MNNNEAKKCSHCGELKPLSRFRKYYGGRAGHYRYCLDCEKIMTRYKYLVSKGDDAAPCEREELAKIEKLYEYRKQLGLETPGRNNYGGATSLIDKMLAEAEAKVQNESL